MKTQPRQEQEQLLKQQLQQQKIFSCFINKRLRYVYSNILYRYFYQLFNCFLLLKF